MFFQVSAELEQALHDLGSSLEVANLEAIKTNCSRPLGQLKMELAVGFFLVLYLILFVLSLFIFVFGVVLIRV